MPALISEQFRIHNAQQFQEAFGEAVPTNMYFFIGRPQAWDTAAVSGVTSYVGQPTGSQHSNSYLASPDENNPSSPVDSFKYESEIFDDMVSLKKIQSTDVRLVSTRYNWISGQIYSMYRPNYSADYKANSAAENASNLYNAKFYVINNYRVYKCIYNGSAVANPNGIASTVAPTGTSNSVFTTADGYKWKFMYSIGTDDVVKFLTTSYMPLPATWGVGGAGDPTNGTDVKNAAVDGSIDTVVIKNGGSGYTDGTYTSVPVRGDFTRRTGGIQALATIVVSGGTVTSVTITTAGKYYSYGVINVNSTEISGIGAGTNASLEVIIPPSGGHGFNVYKELGAKRVMVNSRLQYDETLEFPVDNDFRRIGIIRDPKDSTGIDATGSTYNALTAIKFPTGTAATFAIDEIVTQATTGAKGRVVSWDSSTKIMKLYQTKYEGVTTGNQGGSLQLFSGSNAITGATSAAVATPDTAYSLTASNLTFANGYSRPEIEKYTGDIIYVENRRTVSRSIDQIEDVKLVVEF
jgi:hypothetical protein